MSITRWEPFRDLVTTQDRFNQLFNDTFARAFGDEKEVAPRAWIPAVDIYETSDGLVLKAELPGVNPDDVEIRVEDNTLYLKGERKFAKEVKEENLHRIERSYGTFTRSFVLPSTIDSDKVKAEYANGVLTLTMSKREEAKPRTIRIDVPKA
jgi:HSP20 family protein